MLFGDACLPDPDLPGSALLWHDFRILRRMHVEFENAQQKQASSGGENDPDELELKEDGGWQAPPPLKGKHRVRVKPGVGSET